MQAPAKAPAWIRPCHGWSPTPLPYRGARTQPSPFFFSLLLALQRDRAASGPSLGLHPLRGPITGRSPARCHEQGSDPGLSVMLRVQRAALASV